jgi:hypothetical protein
MSSTKKTKNAEKSNYSSNFKRNRGTTPACLLRGQASAPFQGAKSIPRPLGVVVYVHPLKHLLNFLWYLILKSQIQALQVLRSMRQVSFCSFLNGFFQKLQMRQKDKQYWDIFLQQLFGGNKQHNGQMPPFLLYRRLFKTAIVIGKLSFISILFSLEEAAAIDRG